MHVFKYPFMDRRLANVVANVHASHPSAWQSPHRPHMLRDVPRGMIGILAFAPHHALCTIIHYLRGGNSTLEVRPQGAAPISQSLEWLLRFKHGPRDGDTKAFQRVGTKTITTATRFNIIACCVDEIQRPYMRLIVVYALTLVVQRSHSCCCSATCHSLVP